jgi:YVTN family beta-propeller protein
MKAFQLFLPTLTLLIALSNTLSSLTNAYVANSGGADNVLVYDTSGTGTTLIAMPPVGANPAMLAVSPDGLRAYVCNLNSTMMTPSSVSVIQTATNTEIVRLNMPATTNSLYAAFTPDATKAYIVNFQNAAMVNSTITVIDNTLTPPAVIGAPITVGLRAQMIAITPDGTRAYVPNFASDSVTVIDTLNDTVLTTIPVGNGPIHLAISPDGGKVYVTNYLDAAGTVSVIDTSTDTVSSTITIPPYMMMMTNSPQFVLFTPDGQEAYVANYDNDTLTVINANTDLISIPHLPLAGSGPFYIVISPDGANLYVAESGTNLVNVVSTASHTNTANIVVGSLPVNLAVTPDGSKVYVANSGSANIHVIDTATNIATTVPIVGTATWIGITPAVESVTNLVGFQRSERFLTQSDLINVITWEVDPNSNASGFNIYRDAALTDLAGTVGPNFRKFQDHNRKKNQVYTYYVVAVDRFGHESPVTSVQVNP